MEEYGDTTSNVYNEISEQAEQAQAALNPSKWARINLAELIDIDGVVAKAQEAGEEGGKTLHTQALKTAREIANDSELSKLWADQFNIDPSTEEGFTRLVGIIQGDLTNAYSDAASKADELNGAQTSLNGALEDYNTLQGEVDKDIKILNTAYKEMIQNKKLDAGTVSELISKYPQLTKYIQIQNGEITIETQYLKDACDARYDDAIAAQQSERDKTEAAIEGARTRIKMYKAELEVLLKVYGLSLEQYESMDYSDIIN